MSDLIVADKSDEERIVVHASDQPFVKAAIFSTVSAGIIVSGVIILGSPSFRPTL